MKTKTKLIASIISVCLVCAVFAIGVFALKTANLKIGGDVSFSATGVEASITNVTLTGAQTDDQVLSSGEIDTSMTQAEIDSTFANWQTLELDFNENGDDIVFAFDIENDSTNKNNYIELDYEYSFTTSNPNVEVYPFQTNDYVISPIAEEATSFKLSIALLDKELNVPENTKLNLTISLKHTEPVAVDMDCYSIDDTDYASLVGGLTANNGALEIPSVITDGTDNAIVRTIMGESFMDNTDIVSLILPHGLTRIGGWAFSGCANLESVNIPKGVYLINYSFVGCDKLNSVTFSDTSSQWLVEPEYTEDLIASYPGKSLIQASDSVSAAEKLAEGCYFEVCYHESLDIVGDFVLAYTWYYESVCLVAYMGNEEEVTLPTTEYTYSLGNGAAPIFVGETITSLIIPNCVTAVYCNVFGYCSLENITFGAGVTFIETESFRDCNNLKKAAFKDPTGWFGSLNYPSDGEIEGDAVTTFTSQLTEANATLLKTITDGDEENSGLNLIKEAALA